MPQRLSLVVLAALLVLAEPCAALDRPKLQVLNGTAQTVDVFWLRENGERVPNGSVAPGKHAIIGTTLGHRFAIVGREDKSESVVTAEVPVQAFRVGGVPAFYTQQASAGGFPVTASAKVNPYALKEAVYLIDMMLANRPDVRAAMVKSGARLCILAHNEFTCDQPEWAWLADEPVEGYDGVSTRDFRDARARGMGGSLTDPYCSCAEENLLAYEGDPYSTECILIHELAHNIHLRGMNNVDATFDQRVKAAYHAAMKAGLWAGKYPSVNHHEYFAEGVQSWFDNNRENDHDHNHVNTRAELLDYDPGLAALCREVFGDTVLKYTKPQTRLTGHLAGYDPAKAPKFVWPERLKRVRDSIRAAAVKRSEQATTPVKQRPSAARFDPVLRHIEGWQVHVDPALLSGEHQEEGTRALTMLANHLQRVQILIPPEPLQRMKKLEIWIEHHHPTLKSKSYHPNEKWLVDHGNDPRLAKKVHIPRAADLLSREQMLKHPAVILHELAHAYHDQVLGFDHPEIIAAYEHAKTAGSYQSVLAHTGRKVEHYALTNAKEYFAEGSEAFFYRNDFYPFVRAELRQHDRILHDLLMKIWEPKP